MKNLLLALCLSAASLCHGQLPTPSSGSVQRFELFKSIHVRPRNVDVWLPEGYDPSRRYDVLYLHDGQMLFDSTANWNHQEWLVDETVTRLVREKKLRPCIVVGVWNTGEYRHAEYFPQRALDYLPASTARDSLVALALKGRPLADEYLRFLVKELKPFIDAKFSTHPGRAHTFIGGSSMGGLISLYALCEYPKVFGGAACLSTHWVGTFQQNSTIPAAFQAYLQAHLPKPRHHKLYFDHGTAGLDALYPPHQAVVDQIGQAKGYRPGRHWQSLSFEGKEHSERAWSERLHLPLLFLMGKN